MSFNILQTIVTCFYSHNDAKVILHRNAFRRFRKQARFLRSFSRCYVPQEGRQLNQLSLSLRFLPVGKQFHESVHSSADVAPLRARGSGGLSPHAARPHGRLRAVTQGFALRALPLRGLDCPVTRHPHHPFNVVATSVSFPPAEALKSEGCGNSQCAERTTLRNRGQAPARARSLRREPTP